MQLRNCSRCGNIFSYINQPICPACQKLEDQEFEIIKQYLREHPNSTVLEVSEATGLDQHLIQEWVRQGRLISTEFHITTECQRCGKPIVGGRYCRACAEELTAEWSGKKSTAASSWEDNTSGRDIKQTGKLHIKDQLKD